MNFDDRSQKYSSSPPRKNKRTKNNSIVPNNIKTDLVYDPIVFGLDDTLLNLYASYIMSSNRSVHRFTINNLFKLMNTISETNFNNNQIQIMKYHFIKLALDGKKRGLNGDLLLSDIGRQMDISSFINDPSFLREVSNEEVKYVEESVGKFLDTLTLDSKVENLMRLYNDYRTADVFTKSKYIEAIKIQVTQLNTEFRKNNTGGYNSSNIFRLSAIEDSAEDIHHYITDPSFMLPTGMQGMNAMLGGGFQKDRLYCLFGMSGEGKTVTMVNLLYQVWKYNKGHKCSDPTKKPCIILLTMENLVIEYVCSLFHVITRGKNLKNCSSADEVLREFRERKFEYSTIDDIELIIEYQPVKSKDTSYLYEMVERASDEGFECICFFMDYLMRIRPLDYTHDMYTDLGNVSDDFKTFCIFYHIPLITASQLNREASKIIDEGRSRNQIDIIKRLGRATIGDSVQIDRNIDGAIILVPEVSQTGIRYMAFKLTKHRYEILQGTKLAIFQPMYEGSYIAMVEDVFDPVPAFKETLARDAEDIREAFGDVERVSINNTIKSLVEMSSSREMLMPGIIKPKEPLISLPVENMIINSQEEEKPIEIVVRIPPEQRQIMHKKLFPERYKE